VTRISYADEVAEETDRSARENPGGEHLLAATATNGYGFSLPPTTIVNKPPWVQPRITWDG
jgi:hypothetical protein